jgi:hypothetical protein
MSPVGHTGSGVTRRRKVGVGIVLGLAASIAAVTVGSLAIKMGNRSEETRSGSATAPATAATAAPPALAPSASTAPAPPPADSPRAEDAAIAEVSSAVTASASTTPAAPLPRRAPPPVHRDTRNAGATRPGAASSVYNPLDHL